MSAKTDPAAERQLERLALSAQQEGLQSAARDEPETACPYPEGGSFTDQKRRRNWLKGWSLTRRRGGPRT